MIIIKIIETSKYNDKRFYEVSEKNILNHKVNMSDCETVNININHEKKYQEFLGFGGAFTESGAYVLNSVSEKTRKEVIKAYFNEKEGNGYEFCRTHINSCDFSLSNYTYVEENDETLETFNIERDRKYLISFIKAAQEERGDKIFIYASPWSPPAYMKTNNRMNNGGSLKENYYELWAKYFVRYIKEYEKEGIIIDGVTIQNEPMAKTPWDNCIYTSEQERNFLKILSGEFKKNNLCNVKIIIWDHNKDIMKERIDTILSDKEAFDNVCGIGFHWYAESDSQSNIDNEILEYAHNKYGKKLIFTEGCNPLYNIESGTLIGEWWTGEKYARHIIADLNSYTVAWTDWNMVLNEKGGPNHVNNNCDAPILVNTETGEIYYNSPYYYIGHFSRYIKKGAIRLDYGINSDNLKTTVWESNGKVIIVILNETEKKQNYKINYKNEYLEYNIDKRSIQTIIL